MNRRFIKMNVGHKHAVMNDTDEVRSSYDGSWTMGSVMKI